ncbi:cytochrome P450 [Aestuariivivens sediminis]|uniref:cytochrome P450 n=1 Tax=Aestuariivivens sediminis TaxID=2913557 RepID=UPI001F59F872|nr:cytochrome P450 [Aestuariivivens sediminis]
MLVNTIKEEHQTSGPSLLEFFRGATRFPAFHFYDLMAKYGDVVACGPYFYLINHPDIAKDILNRDQKDFSQNDFIGRRVTTLFGHGMVTSQGELWSSQRRLLNPVFSHHQLHEQMDEALEQIDCELDLWGQSLENNDQIDLADVMGTWAIMISGRLLFHSDLREYVGKIKHVVKTGTGYIAKGLPFYMPLWVPSPLHLKIKKISKQIDDILEAIIQQRQLEAFDNDDLAGTLMQSLGKKSSSAYEKRVMLDEMKTMLAGGYFPISCSLSMLWYALGEQPKYYKKMCDEIRSKPADYTFHQNFYHDFPITTSIVFEAMRLYPVAFSIWRKAKVNFTSHGVMIPKGKSVCISLFNIHRHPEFWEQPDSFMPERFTNANAKTRPKHYFMPFGWGNRKCIGDHYAIMVIFLTLIRTLQRFDVEICHEPLRVRRAALICPKRVPAKIKWMT